MRLGDKIPISSFHCGSLLLVERFRAMTFPRRPPAPVMATVLRCRNYRDREALSFVPAEAHN